MLRPERMSRVSVAGVESVMDDVIETTHDLHLLHLSDYDGSWAGFEQGDPVEGADDVSGRLVTVRSLESTLGVDADEVDRGYEIDDLDAELERVRGRANDLDDRRSEVEEELRQVEERLSRIDPFVDLGVDFDLLGGYETLVTAVGLGDADAVRTAVEGADGVADSLVRTAEEGAVAVFARPTDASVVDGTDADPLEDALVGVDFERLQVPEYDTSNPEVQRRELRERRERLQSRLADVESEIADLREEVAPFLLAAEERLSIRVQKAEAPLSFATTTNSFVAEGWVPTPRVDELEAALQEAVGDRVEFEELERASYTEDGQLEDREPAEEVDRGHDRDRDRDRDPTPAPDGGTTNAAAAATPTATDGAGGGEPVTMGDSPPTLLENPAYSEPMEVLVNAAERPKYTEFDPTFIVFLTFPVMFGFMIGDLAYGLLYMLVGYGLYSRFENPAVSALGGVGMWAGLFTAIFGVLYGEFFGLHFLGELVWEGPIGALVGVEHTPIHKGLQPTYQAFATGWLVLSLFVGLLHVGLGHVLGFVRELYGHGVREAVFAKGSWVALMFGVWAWIFSTHARSQKPEFLFEVLDTGEAAAIPLGFAGLPEVVGLAGLAAFGVGFVALIVGEGLLAVEVLQALVNVLSYARLMAVLLAKAGLAFVVNLLAFGAVETEKGEFHFIAIEGYADPATHGEVMFAGLMNAGGGLVGVVGLLAGVVLLVVGHLFVFALGIISAGLQGVRLEYVEFFGKFYDGGGRSYDPFGYSRDHTTED
jgi:V/A-type H+-transporting ATPase subunit I